ncbi:MAG TPA: hypothetical protein VFZ09_04350 [Archangium sp.]|uniref:hypothetical protein n=1 Tax=Archangium sp. TaxID=1872627 RepID=UPI002E3748CF|nr:hypothetical protein [Archangium sp.]HEX5745451.1 hypothetical protein [Archangium sp.]
MTDISIQLHALPEELLPIMSECARDFSLHVTALRFKPFTATAIDADVLHEPMLDGGVRRIAFTITKPSLPAETLNGFLDRNPDALLLDLGRLKENGLGESWLTARTSNTVALEIWKRVAQKFRSATKAGAIAIDPRTGATSKLKAHRYSEGARALQSKGVVMLPVAGSSIIKLPD